MTTREYFQAVLDANISEEMNNASKELIRKLDEKNAKRKSADTKQKRETADRRTAVLEFLKEHEGAFVRDAIAEATGLTAGQVSSACTSLIDGGLVVKSKVKIDKAEKVAYSLA